MTMKSGSAFQRSNLMFNKRVLVFSGARSEFFILSSLIDELVQENCHVTLLVAASHYITELSGAQPYYTKTNAHNVMQCVPSDEAFKSPTKMLGDLIDQLASIEWRSYDVCVVLGDRYETLGFSICATLQNKLLVHLHGGEKTVGSYDDSFRHAITKLSHYHFVACEEYALRVIQLGEDPGRVFNYGAIGAEVALKLARIEPDTKFKELISDLGDFVLVTIHPETIDQSSMDRFLNIFFDTLATTNHRFLFNAPGYDQGYEDILKHIEIFLEEHPDSVFEPNVGSHNYFFLARNSVAVIGNSSSAIIELPMLGCTVINVGNRQNGRVIPPEVISVEFDKNQILNALTDCTDRKNKIHKMAKHRNFLYKKTPRKISPEK